MNRVRWEIKEASIKRQHPRESARTCGRGVCGQGQLGGCRPPQIGCSQTWPTPGLRCGRSHHVPQSGAGTRSLAGCLQTSQVLVTRIIITTATRSVSYVKARQTYKSTVQSVLCYCLICWGGSLSVKNRVLLDHVVRSASKTIGSTLPTVDELYETKNKGHLKGHFSPIARILLCCTIWL